MSRLSAAARRALPASDFAGPGRTYPDQDENHARLAVAMASGKPEQAAVDAAVHRKYPSISISSKG